MPRVVPLFVITLICSARYAIASGLGFNGYSDSFCRDVCSSLAQCNAYFGGNFSDLEVTINTPVDEKVLGDSLTHGRWLGKTIARQNFETHFVLDIASSLNISPCRVYVSEIRINSKHNAWIFFRMFPGDFDSIKELSLQGQNLNSTLLQGKVTSGLNRSYRVRAIKWDLSVKLMISLEVVGGSQINQDGQYFVPDFGSIGFCTNTQNSFLSAYCEFEKTFRDDVAFALEIPSQDILVLYVRSHSLDSVEVGFRLRSHKVGLEDDEWIKARINELHSQLNDFNSHIFTGNITIRLDPSFGLSSNHGITRNVSPFLPYAFEDHRGIQKYEKCRVVGRCPRSWSSFDESIGASQYSSQAFSGGSHAVSNAFANFENWRQGSTEVVSEKSMMPNNITGAHWSPFDFTSLGPSVQTFNGKINSGLVLNRLNLKDEISKQIDLISQIENKIDWLQNQSKLATLDAQKRFKRDARTQILASRDDEVNRLGAEIKVLTALNASQCSLTEYCHLTFNTSSLDLSGSINSTGYLSQNKDGSEVALWSFDSINLDRNVRILVVGQRPLVLLSRSSLFIDTPIVVNPGTLGGFPGGYSVSRPKSNRLAPVCQEDSRKGNCDGDVRLSFMDDFTLSNNVNGPGSASVRFYLFT